MNLTSPMPELTEDALAEIYRIGLLRAPSEACGLLLEIPFTTSLGKTSRVLEIPNRSLRPHDSYVMESDDLKLAMDGKPDQNAAAWHTHPGGLVGPSTKDMRTRADLADIPMLVVALTQEGPVAAWF